MVGFLVLDFMTCMEDSLLLLDKELSQLKLNFFSDYGCGVGSL